VHANPVTSQLGRLIQTCNAAERAYRSAAQRVGDPAVRRALRHVADRRRDCVLALSNVSAGGSARSGPGEPGSERPSLETLSLDAWLLRKLRHAEERSLVAFSDTLGLQPAIEVRTVVEECYREVRRAYGGLVTLTAPPAPPLSQAPESAGAGRRRHGPSARMLGGVLALAVAGSLCGWLLREEMLEGHNHALRENRFLHTLLDAHHMFALEPPPGVVLPPAEFELFASQIARRLDASIRLPAADVWPHMFLGGRVLPLGRAPAALLMFEREGDTVSVFVARDQAHRSWSVFNEEVDDDAVSFAKEGDFQVGVVGRISLDELGILKHIVGQRQGRT